MSAFDPDKSADGNTPEDNAAYRAGVDDRIGGLRMGDNPFSSEPSRLLWIQGWEAMDKLMESKPHLKKFNAEYQEP